MEDPEFDSSNGPNINKQFALIMNKKAPGLSQTKKTRVFCITDAQFISLSHTVNDVYFDQHLGAAHSKRLSKYAFVMLFTSCDLCSEELCPICKYYDVNRRIKAT